MTELVLRATLCCAVQDQRNPSSGIRVGNPERCSDDDVPPFKQGRVKVPAGNRLLYLAVCHLVKKTPLMDVKRTTLIEMGS